MTAIVTVPFHGDTIFAVERDDGVFIAITPICKSLGLDAPTQRRRIQNDPILGEGGVVMTFPSPGGPQETFCLRLDLVHGWLFTIDESRVKDEATRQKVLAYKRECYRVLARHFLGLREVPQEPGWPSDPALQRDHIKLRKVENAGRWYGEAAAREMWRRLGLETVPAMHRGRRRKLELRLLRGCGVCWVDPETEEIFLDREGRQPLPD